MCIEQSYNQSARPLWFLQIHFHLLRKRFGIGVLLLLLQFVCLSLLFISSGFLGGDFKYF